MSTRRRVSLLLLDDSPEDRHVFRSYLEQVEEYAFRFLEAEDAEQGLRICKDQAVDCVLLDYELPGANGLEFLRRLELEEGLLRPPVVMVTGRGNERIAVKALKGGASDYLVKAEVTTENLYRAVRNAVEKEDIRKRLNEQLLRTGVAETQLDLALEVMEHGDALLVLDADFRVVLVNENQERISGTRREESLGRKIWDVWPLAANPQGRYWSEYHRAMRERVPVHFEEYYAPMDLWTDVSVYPTRAGGISVFFRDISERKRQEERLRVEEKQRSEFEQQLIGIVSHDLRNPITAISLGVSLLLRREGLDEKILKTLVRIHSSAERAIRMVRDLLDFTQARLGGGIVLHREHMELHPLLQLVVEEIHMAYPDRQVRLELEGDGLGTWDSDRMAQLITNLVTNALKYSPEGSLVTVRTRGEPEAVVLEVHNPGDPIAPQVLTHLFEPMRRGVQFDRGGGRSIGLGLFIVDHVVRAHGGTINVRSSAPEGTTFSVRLPRLNS